jgi:CheY-like chemotaxis protein
VDVLIVDDDGAVRRVYTKALERAGFMVGAVDNGLAAFVELQEHSFRAIVCDIRMPFLEGRKLYEQLVADMPQLAERTVFVTAAGSEEPIRRFLAKTGRPVLHKPVELADLVAAVRVLVESRGSPA